MLKTSHHPHPHPPTKKQLQSLLGIFFPKKVYLQLKWQNLSVLTTTSSKRQREVQVRVGASFDKIKAYLTRPPILIPHAKGKSMKLYIYASKLTMGSMLAKQDENDVEMAIYYLSRVLNDVETRYSEIYKLFLCLYFSCTKLKHYIKPVYV